MKQIAFTGQAESLVIVGRDGNVMMNAISWMDERSVKECAVLSEQFSQEEFEAITGQQAILPTWPATKILWLKENRPEIYRNVETFMLLKDFVIYKLTNKKVADCSIATFTSYFDIYNKCYWYKMLEAIGISESRLPPLVEPCTLAGCLTEKIAASMHLSTEVKINVGTLDHFAGMIGTGNVCSGSVTLSTGTVMALAVMADNPRSFNSEIAMHYGFLPNTYVMLPVAESGGVSLEWFNRTCMAGIDLKQIDQVLMERARPNEILFLPYLVGTNAPEFDKDATGVFFGLRQKNDVYDMACAVMEGVSFMLRKNCDYIRENNTEISRIVATGGGSKSPVWCQMQADITGLPIVIPAEKEAACFGAAIIAAVEEGMFTDYKEAADHCIRMVKCYEPHTTEVYEKKYKKFCALYDMALNISRAR